MSSPANTFNSALRLWDISPPVCHTTPAFPGDTVYTQTWVSRISADNPVNVSRIQLSPHLGAHADAPLHYDEAGQAIGFVDLAPYIGRCRVIHCIDVRPLVHWDDIAHAVSKPQDLPPRVLVRTYHRMPVDRWDPLLAAFAPELVMRLADMGVMLIGIDSASVDPADSKQLPSHQILRMRQLRVLENLCLDDIAEGDYELIALPLKLTTSDASPVRAVLRQLCHHSI